MFDRSQPIEMPENKRRSGRLMPHGVTCTLGEVVDLAANGARVLARRKPSYPDNASFRLTFSSDFGQCEVGARIARLRRIGFRRYEIGIAFNDVSEEAREMLCRIAGSAPQEAFTLFHSLSMRKRA